LRAARIWTPNYSSSAKPLYEAIKRGEQKLLVWWEEQEKAFKEINRALQNAPLLGLLDVMKPCSCMSMRDRGQILGS
jgi:hypothetical protein